MKILAATPVDYSTTKYIAELTGQELVAITMFYTHSKIPVADAKGARIDRDKDKLEAGDIIEESITHETMSQVRTFLDDRKQIDSCSAQIRASLTKLQNVLKLK